MSQQQFEVEVMQELYTQEQLQDLDGMQHNADMDEMEDYPSDIKSRHYGKEVCLYCGETKGDNIECCGENHFTNTRD